MKKYHDLGTAANVMPLNELGALPTMNLRKSSFENAEELSGENLKNRYLGRRIACSHCPVGCIHLATLREPYEDEPYFYKTSFISYDYELIYALGSMLGLANAEHLLKLMNVVEIFGLDAMSTGVVLAWATEAMEKKLITERETMNIKLSWGDYISYIEAVKKIVEQPNEFYKSLAQGVEHASSIYSGQDFALAFGGNEMAGYHTGPGTHIGSSIGMRHSHLDNAGYSLDQKVLIKEKLTTEQLAKKLIAEEEWHQILTSLVICLFAREIYKPDIVSNALTAVGFDYSLDNLQTIGEKIYKEKYRFKVREGFSFDKLRLPKKIFEIASPIGELDEDFIKNAIEYTKKYLNDSIQY